MRNPRQLRHRIAIQYLVAGSPPQKPSGDPDEEWTDFLSDIAASIEPLKGAELFRAQGHHAEVDTRIVIRYRAGISAEMRVIHEARTFEILAVIDREMLHRELELMTKLYPQQPDVGAGAALLDGGGYLVLG